jgi:hypothetical protein
LTHSSSTISCSSCLPQGCMNTTRLSYLTVLKFRIVVETRRPRICRNRCVPVVGTMQDVLGFDWPSFRPKSGSKSSIPGQILKKRSGPSREKVLASVSYDWPGSVGPVSQGGEGVSRTCSHDGTSCTAGACFDTGPPQVAAGPLSFCRFSQFVVGFLGLPAGFPALPALF